MQIKQASAFAQALSDQFNTQELEQIVVAALECFHNRLTSGVASAASFDGATMIDTRHMADKLEEFISHE